MSKNTNISELINYISYDGSGNVVFTTVSAATTNTDKFLVSDTGVLKFRTAAQLLSDIGAQASGSYQAALSGTGFVKISGTTISYDNSTYATQTYVGTAISNLVASAPSTLDTLNELATALGNDANFATTVATSIGTKQPQLNGTGFVKISGTTISYDSSTYLTTGTAGTTYVPYTGATGNVSLGNYELGAKYVIAEGSAGLGGVISIKQDAAYLAKGNGYSSITSSFVAFDFYGYTGVSTYKNFTLRFDGLTNNTRRQYTLPDSDGTLALTSNLSSYLPLAGGTLTGPLIGTSAAFSTSVLVGTGTVVEPLTVSYAAHGLISQHRQSSSAGVGQNFYMKFNDASGTAVNYAGVYADIQVNTTGAHNGRMILQVANAGSLLSAVTIANTGATTFYSSVTSTGFYSTTGSNFATSSGRVGVGTTTPADKFVVSNSGAEGIEFGFDTGIPYLFGYNRSTSAYKPIAFVGSGNVIITQGTIVDNGSKLQVTGSATFSPSGASGIILAADSSDTNNSGRLFFMRTGGEGFVIMNNAGNLSFRSNSVPGNTSGNERMKLDSSYNLILNNGLTVTNTATLGSALVNTSTLWNNEKLGVQISNSAGWSTIPSIMRLTNYISGGVTKITFTDSNIIDGWFGMVPVSGNSYFAMGFSGYTEQGFKVYQGGSVSINASSIGYANTKLQVNGNSSTDENAGTVFIQHSFSGTNGFGLAISRNASSAAALSLGADTSNNGIISANNTNLRLGKNTSGTFYEYLNINTNGNSVFSGNVLPVSDAVYTLGSPSFRWNHVYTTDLHLSNEGKQNIVDGTWGDWTLQEGENDIFMLNNRSGEKFKIKLEKI